MYNFNAMQGMTTLKLILTLKMKMRYKNLALPQKKAHNPVKLVTPLQGKHRNGPSRFISPTV
jgi:hypothetical protein